MARIGFFDVLDPPTPACVDMVHEAVEAIDFPWHRLLPSMRVRNMPAIPVRWVDLPENRNGQWDGTVKIGDHLAGNGVMSRYVFAHEVGHCVEEWTLSGAVRQALSTVLHTKTTPVIDHTRDTWGPTNDTSTSLSEAAADLFVAAFAPTLFPYGPAGDSAHWTTDVPGSRAVWLREPIQVFSDIPPGHSLHDETAWLVDRGITTGKSDGRFDPDAPVTRGQMAAFLYRALS